MMDSAAVGSNMSIFFNFLTHTSIIVGCLAMVIFVGIVIFKASSTVEVSLRIMSAMLGFLTYISAYMFDISIPALMLQAISRDSFMIYLIPIGSGVIISTYLNYLFRRGGDVASRILIVTAVFMIVTFLDVYVATYNKSLYHNGYNTVLLPNVLFVLSTGFHMIFTAKSS